MLKPVELKIKNFASSFGIDTSYPLFSWQLISQLKNQTQKYYRILVTEDEKDSIFESCILWDSGKVESTEQLSLKYSGSPLQSLTWYYWKVGVWDQEGNLVFSNAETFNTGYLRDETWTGKWIGNGRCKPFYARHTFELTKKVKRVFALVTGLGHFKLYINGSKIGNNEMDPGWTNYHRSIQYVSFNVSNSFLPGLNVIGMHIGNGFFAGDSGGRHFYTMGKGYEAFGCELMTIGEWHIEYEDGTKSIISTDASSWKVRDSATTLANVYGSENYDARLYPHGWDNSSFDDNEWENACVTDPPAGKLVIQNQPPITVKHIYDTIGIVEPIPNVYVFNLGQNMSGQFEIYVSGHSGCKVTIKPGELMREDGTIATPWDIVTYSEFILAGTGEVEVWKPDFSCYGARWVQIEGCTRNELDLTKPFIHDVKGHFVTSASLDTGFLTTDDVRIAKLAGIITKAIESNLQSVHSDCPTIEKLGWVETASLMGPSIMYVKQVEELWLKIVYDMIEAQTEEGLIPDIAPEYSKFEDGFRDSIAWGNSSIIASDLLYETYGCQTAIEQAYPAMKVYMAYLKRKEIQGGIINHGLGDWGIEPQTGGDYIENVETAIYCENYRLMSKFASMLELHEEAVHYKAESERIKQVYNQHLLYPLPFPDQHKFSYRKLNGAYDADNQVIQAIPLFLI